MKQVELKSDSIFSYTCGRCQKCCNGRRVYLNPYEIAKLAQSFGLTTTEFIRQHVNQSNYSLRHQTNGDCTLLSEAGCSVHVDRPLACRLYPLARRVDSAGQIRFAQIPPEPETKGVYGSHGTIADFLRSQATDVYETFADKYFQFFSELTIRWAADTSIQQMMLETVPMQHRLLMNEKHSAVIIPLFDLDAFLSQNEPNASVAKNMSPEEKAERQLEIIGKKYS